MAKEGQQRAAFRALALARREGITFDEAAGRLGRRAEDLAPAVSPALRRTGGGLVPAPEDNLPRHMWGVTDAGVESILVRGSEAARRVRAHWQGVWRRRDSGDPSLVRRVTVAPGVSLTDDLGVIDEQAWQKNLDVDDIYDLS